MNKLKVCMWTVLSLFFVNQAMASLALDATRYIYKEDTGFVSIMVNNTSEEEYGAQMWVDNIVEEDTRPTFIVTPSFFKVKKDTRQVIRLMKVSDHMPQDQESIYWLNLQEIPPALKGSGIALAIRTKVKVIYRPEGLPLERDKAEEHLSVEEREGERWLVNTTPYIFAIASVFDANDKPIELTKEDTDNLSMFMPGERVRVGASKVTAVHALNDYGSMKKYQLKGYK